jgi:UDP-N-acetylmuramoyl-L-alanyl-D-glutamate--2,6-diaminopimelate ligase
LLFEVGPKIAIVNVDDPHGRRLASEFDCVTFSAEGAAADFAAQGVSFDTSGARFTANHPSTGLKHAYIEGNRPVGGDVEVRTGLPGDFNVANALGAFAAAAALGVAPDVAAEGLGRAERVPGRFEPIDEGQAFAVLVDYAHTPDSLGNVLRAARRLTEGRVIAVFGAGGDRDRDKRPKMGWAGAALSDLAIVTSDNPRSEDPDAIVAEVVAGIEDRRSVEVEPDRRAAIALALGSARAGDTVVIAGKGHEQGQEFENGRRVPFDDREVAREELRKLGSHA